MVERKTAPDAWRMCALVGWVLAVLVVCLHALWKPHANSTYPIFANAGRNWLEGRDLYGGVVEDLDVYRYSPLTAAAFAPLSLAPNGPAGVLWRLFNVAVFLAALLWWARAVLPAPLDHVGRSRFLLLVLPLSVPCMYNGQSNLLVLGLVLAAVAGAAEGRWNLSSIFVALACMLKLYPLTMGLLLAALYPRQLLHRQVLALLACLALPFLLQNPSYVGSQYYQWVHSLMADDRQVRVVALWPHDVRLLFRVWLAPLPPVAYPVLQFLAGAGSAALCVAGRARRWAPQRQLTLLTGLGCCWMTAFGPATESNTFVLLAPSLGASLLAAWRPGQAGRLRGMLWASYVLLVLTHMANWFPWGVMAGSLGLQPLAALLFMGCLTGQAIWSLGKPASLPQTPVSLPQTAEATQGT